LRGLNEFREASNQEIQQGEKRLTTKIEAERATTFAQFFQLFAYALPRKIRKRNFEPSLQDLLQDHLQALSEHHTPRAQSWLAFWFRVHTVITFIDCFWVMLKSPLVRCILSLVPAAVRRWWLLLLLWWK
jgi:hypothetical protein